MTDQKRKKYAVLEVLMCSALWSIAGIFMKLIPWSSFVIAGARSVLAGTVAFIYLRAVKLPFVLNKKTLLSGAALWLTMALFCAANKLTTSANAIVLQFTSPVFIMLISAVFFGKKFSKADIITVAVTLGGISLFFFDKLSGGSTLGNIVALCSGVTFACYYVSLGSCTESERVSSIIIANVLSFFMGIPFVFTTHPVFAGMPLLYIAILGILQLGIPYVLLARGSEYCPPLACSLLGALEPLLNPLWVFIFDGEAPGTYALVGGVIVIATISLWCVYNDRKAKAEAVA